MICIQQCSLIIDKVINMLLYNKDMNYKKQIILILQKIYLKIF